MKILSLGFLLFSTLAFSQEQLAFSKITIPRDELRQQRLLNLFEFRCSYDHPMLADQCFYFLAETFRDGKQIGRYRLSIGNGSHERKAKGIISVGWRKDFRQLVTINDEENIFFPWPARVRIPAKEFVEPEFDWEFTAFCFAKSLPEHRTTRDVDLHGSDVLIFPVFGLTGDCRGQINFDAVVTSTDFVNACTRAGGNTEILVYIYISTGGYPPLTFTR